MSHGLRTSISATRSDESSTLSAAEQTRFSWARLVRSVAELPEVYHPFVAALPTNGAFPYAVLTPTFAGFLRREPEKLVCTVGDILYVAEKVKSSLAITRYACADVQYLQAGAVLLNDWLEIHGRTDEGTFVVTRFKFNAVTERLFAPFIEKIRGVTDYPSGIDREAELIRLDQTDLLSFKFRNYARRSILPGAQFIASAAQPEIRRTVVKLAGLSYQRTVATAHLLILTNRELIMISDDPDSPRSGNGSRYGGVWGYIPLGKITGVDQSTQDSGLLKLTVQLPFADRIEVLFQPDRRTVLDAFVAQLKSVALS